MPGYEFHVISNQGDFIGASIGEVKDSAVMGILLAMLVLYVFLRRINTTLIVSVSIPVSIIATFNLMLSVTDVLQRIDDQYHDTGGISPGSRYVDR